MVLSQTTSNANLDCTIKTGSSLRSKRIYYLHTLELGPRRYEINKITQGCDISIASAPYLICARATSSRHVATREWLRGGTRRATVGRRGARRLARAGTREPSSACLVPALGWRGRLSCRGRARGDRVDRGPGRVASVRWPRDIGPLVPTAPPVWLRFPFSAAFQCLAARFNPGSRP
jgi:hypothetical protein